MKRVFIITLLITAGFAASAQDSLSVFNHNREHIKQRGMEVLGSWAIANIVSGFIGAAHNTGPDKYVYQMNGIWNIINLAAAISGHVSADKNIDKQLSPQESLKQQRKIEQIFLVNGGLDFAYIGAGIYLNHRGTVDNSNKLRGYGSSIILQGAFLLVFDATMYSTEKHNGNKLRHFLQKTNVGFNGKQLGMSMSF